MKRITTALTTFSAIFILIVLSAQTSVAQQFTHLRLHRVGGTDASVNWGISDPAGVAYYEIERSYDGEIFELVAEVPATADVRYSYRDNTVLPGIISYRVTSFNTDGTTTESPVEVLRLLRRK
jgi:hypothetical protein